MNPYQWAYELLLKATPPPAFEPALFINFHADEVLPTRRDPVIWRHESYVRGWDAPYSYVVLPQ